MSLDVKQFHKFIITPTMQKIGVNNFGFEQLILGTALTESKLQYLRQFSDGPAKGVYQMEDATHKDIHENFLKYKPELKLRIANLLAPNISIYEQIYSNLNYATAMCAAHYLRYLKQMPQANNLPEMAKLWKNFYNTKNGKGTEADFINKAKPVLEI